jgi:hypothetical protein
MAGAMSGHDVPITLTGECVPLGCLLTFEDGGVVNFQWFPIPVGELNLGQSCCSLAEDGGAGY